MPAYATSRSRTIILVAALVAIAGGYWWLRGSPQSRAEALLADLQQGFEQGQPQLLVSLLDQDYQPLDHWPELRQFLVAGPADEDPHGHQSVQRLLASYFLRHRQQERQLASTLHELRPLPDQDQQFEAIISLTLQVTPSDRQIPASLSEHRFVLRQRGAIFPSFFIVDHDPLPIR